MGGSNRMNQPRHGSMQFWPRKRAKKIVPTIHKWAKNDFTKVAGFIGYKAGMTHIVLQDNDPKSLTKGQSIVIAVTILECPSLKPYSLRFYASSPVGLQLISEVFAEKIDAPFKKPKSQGAIPQTFTELRLVAYTQPKLTNIGEKKPDLLELAVTGKTTEEKLNFAKALLQKELKVSDVFKEGQYVDLHAVTKGKGFQGTVKRFGVKIRQHKSEKTKRGIGTLGPWTPKKVSWRVPQPGKMGFHTRTEYNKWLLKISGKPEEVIPKGGFLQYGLIKNEYVMVKGSVAGTRKRPIVLTDALRATKKQEIAEIKYISKESKQ